MMNDQVWIDYRAALIGFQMEILILSLTALRYVNPLKDFQRFFSDFSNIVNTKLIQSLIIEMLIIFDKISDMNLKKWFKWN